MKEFRYTFVTEGSSDKALMPILTWLLRENGIQTAIQPEWADLGEVRFNEKVNLAAKIRESIRLYPCDLLFVHRDADTFSREKRKKEILEAVRIASNDIYVPSAVCVVPIRMQEAWLLIDEVAIRYAAGNRNGRHKLDMPPIHKLESLADPKSLLHDLLRAASGSKGRRLQRFNSNQAHVVQRITYFLEDFSMLRNLPAFSALEAELADEISQFL